LLPTDQLIDQCNGAIFLNEHQVKIIISNDQHHIIFLRVNSTLGTKSFKIQEVKNNSFWPGTEVSPSNEFNDDGIPALFEYENIWSKDYFESVVKRFAPTASVKFIKDDFYDVNAIEETAKTGNLPNPTRTLGGWQIFDYILLPYYFIEIEL
jgi:hypothetical protein